MGIAALAAVALTANVAVAADPPATVVCLNNRTATLVVQVPYQGGSAGLGETVLAFIEANAATAPGGLFYAGFYDGSLGPPPPGSYFFVPEVLGETPEDIFDPGYSTNHVTRGACFVVQERTYVTCYANFPDSMRYVGGDEARAMLNELRLAPLLHGVRGEAPVDLSSLAKAISSFSHLLVDVPELDEIEVNPLMAGPGGVLVVDARARLAG